MLIPFEPQFQTQSNRTCGAACLAMVYRSFGKHVPQSEIWPQIARRNASGSLASTTHLMVRDARHQGLAAVAVQVRHPLHALRLCCDAGIRAILNTRLQPDSPVGHYLVLLDIDEQRVVVQDPYFGPQRSLSHAELLKLWQVQLPNAEIAGNVLIAIAEPAPATAPCAECLTAMPPSVECPRCQETVTLAPQRVLGCVAETCATRMWTYLCCPGCDFMWHFGLPRGDEQAEAAAAAAANADDPWKLKPMFAALDQFAALLLSRPAVAANPDLLAQLDFLVGAKEKLTLALAETQARQAEHTERLDAMQQATRQAQEAMRRRQRAASMPIEALDGPALAEALLKTLGFV